MQQAPGVRTTESHSYITVMGCHIDYQYIEVAHSGGQILVAVSKRILFPYRQKHAVTQELLSAAGSARWDFFLNERWTRKVQKAKVKLLCPPRHFLSLFNSTAVSNFVYLAFSFLWSRP